MWHEVVVAWERRLDGSGDEVGSGALLGEQLEGVLVEVAVVAFVRGLNFDAYSNVMGKFEGS